MHKALATRILRAVSFGTMVSSTAPPNFGQVVSCLRLTTPNSIRPGTACSTRCGEPGDCGARSTLASGAVSMQFFEPAEGTESERKDGVKKTVRPTSVC